MHTSPDKAPKRVLIISLAYYPYVGGAEVAIKEITDRISTSDIEFHLVCAQYDANLPHKETIGNVVVHRIGLSRANPSAADLKQFPLYLNKGLFQFHAFFIARKLHKQYRFDAVWAMMAHTAGVPAGLFKRFFPEVGYVLTLQEGDPPEHIKKKMRIFGPLFRAAFTKADVVQAISSFLARWAQDMGAPANPVVIPNGVKVARFLHAPSQEALERAEHALHKKDGTTVLITTSRLVHKNAIDDIIRALLYLPNTTHVAVLGTGPEEAKLRALVEGCALEERVHFLGQVSHEELPAFYHAADIFVRPSRSEGMGNSFIEAMAAGLPVIATQEGGIADFLFDEARNPDKEPTGFAVEVNSPEDIARAVKEICAHLEKTQKIVARARQMVEERYDWDLIARRMRNEVFAKVVSE